MKRRIFTLLSALVVGILAAGLILKNISSSNVAAANSASAASASVEPTTIGKMVVGLDDTSPPMGFRDEKDDLVGYDIDMAREAAKRMNMKVEFMPIDWNTKEDELASKRIDVIWNGLNITEERKKNILFTKPYMRNHQIVMVDTASPIQNGLHFCTPLNNQIVMVDTASPIQSKTDLKGKVVGIQDGSTALEAVNKEEKLVKSMLALKSLSNNLVAIMELNMGRLDAIVLDEVVGRYYLSQKPGQYRILDENFGSEEYGVGLRKEDTELLAKLEIALSAMNADGSAKKIYAKWFEANASK